MCGVVLVDGRNTKRSRVVQVWLVEAVCDCSGGFTSCFLSPSEDHKVLRAASKKWPEGLKTAGDSH